MNDTKTMNDPKETLQPPSNKDLILADLRIGIWAILAILLVVLLVLELAPVQNTSALTVSERFTATSELVNVNSQQYVTTVSGTLYNPTDKPITVDSVLVSITAGKAFRGVDMEGFVIHPRTSFDLHTSWVGGTEFNKVTRITVVVDGEEQVVLNTNAAGTPAVSGAIIFYLILMAIVAWFLIRASKLRYYLHQEKIFLTKN